MLKCFQLLADVLNQIQTLEQVLVSGFHKQMEAMLKAMADSQVSQRICLLLISADVVHASVPN